MTTFQMPQRETTLKPPFKQGGNDSEQLGKYYEKLGHFLILKYPSIRQNDQNENRFSVARNDGQIRTSIIIYCKNNIKQRHRFLLHGFAFFTETVP